jgi:hypothetical protein
MQRRVYMSFMNAKGGWYCQFLESDLKTPLPRKFTFQTLEKVEELIRRGGGMKDLAESDRRSVQSLKVKQPPFRGGFSVGSTTGLIAVQR